jgi:hypothetical protein
LGDETFTISGGTVTQISGTTIQGQSVSVNDRILVINSPGSTGTGQSYGYTGNASNGVYTVTAVGTDMSVSRAADFSGSVNPTGMLIFSENKNAGWMAQSIFGVQVPFTQGSFTWGTTQLQFRTLAGANIAADSIYANYGRIGMWNEDSGSSTYVYANPNATLYTDQTIYLPADTTGTLATEAYVDANSGGGGASEPQVFVQQANPETTNPEYTGPAIWYQLDGSSNIIGKKVRT